MKVFLNDKMDMTEKMKSVLIKVKNNMKKRRKHLFLLTHCFQSLLFQGHQNLGLNNRVNSEICINYNTLLTY